MTNNVFRSGSQQASERPGFFTPRRWVLLFFALHLPAYGYPSARCEDPLAQLSQSQTDWPWWRGPSRSGIAPGNQQPPRKWSEQQNVRWRVALAGRGHGSPTVVGDRVYITTADLQRDVQSVLCLDRDTGNRVWEAVVHEGGLKTNGNKKQNKKASLASTTVACDGERLFVNFLNQEAVWTTALSRQGELMWQRKISPYVVHQGYGSSPALYENLVIVSADNKGGGMIMALDRKTGQVVWQRPRPEKPNYPSPVILNVAGRDQLVLTGCDLATGLDPLTGEELWEIEGATTECVSSTVTDGKHIFTSGGYPKNHISAVAADGSGKVVWENGARNYVPSMLCHNGYLFATLDAGVATCFRCEDGNEQWKARLGGTFTSSPVLVGDLIYATNEEGETFIFSANPTEFQQVAKNKLGTSVFATPVIVGGRIYTRVAQMEDGNRQEYLYCIGEK
jgi:outer membrane protein assembly factor BamB